MECYEPPSVGKEELTWRTWGVRKTGRMILLKEITILLMTVESLRTTSIQQ